MPAATPPTGQGGGLGTQNWREDVTALCESRQKAPTVPFVGADGQAPYGAPDPATTYPCSHPVSSRFDRKPVAQSLGLPPAFREGFNRPTYRGMRVKWGPGGYVVEPARLVTADPMRNALEKRTHPTELSTRSERGSSLTKLLTVMSLGVGALLFLGLLKAARNLASILAYINNPWLLTVLIFLVCYVLYAVRLKRPLAYGIAELLVGLLTILLAAQRAPAPPDTPEFGLLVISLAAGIYIVIRGLDTMSRSPLVTGTNWVRWLFQCRWWWGWTE